MSGANGDGDGDCRSGPESCVDGGLEPLNRRRPDTHRAVPAARPARRRGMGWVFLARSDNGRGTPTSYVRCLRLGGDVVRKGPPVSAA